MNEQRWLKGKIGEKNDELHLSDGGLIKALLFLFFETIFLSLREHFWQFPLNVYVSL